MFPAELRSVENASLLPVHVSLSVVLSTTSYFLTVTSSYPTQMFSSHRSVFHVAERLALISLIDGPHGVKLFQHAYYTTADRAGGSSTSVASASQQTQGVNEVRR